MSLQSFFGTRYPLIQAPLAGVQASAMAIAVSNAGGLGSLPCAMLQADALKSELTALSTGTSNPYNVNFFCHSQPAPDPAAESRWRDALAPYFDEYGIDPTTIPYGAGRLPFSHEIAEVIAPFRPPVVSFHFGLPPPDLLARVKQWGAMVLSSATTLEEARWLEDHGADAVIAQGIEAGGHRGMFLTDDLGTQTSTTSLLPQIAHTVKVPVIAAGGIATADDVARALKRGAKAVQVGTSYMLCDEAFTSAIHRCALTEDGSDGRSTPTALTNLFTGRPARGLVNRLMRELGPISPLAPRFPLATAALAPLRAAAERNGKGDFSPLWSGSNRSGCKAIPAAEMTDTLMALVD